MAVPPVVVTAIVFTPSDEGGVTAVICVAVTTTFSAAAPPMVTLAPIKFVPPMVMGVPPAVGPKDGLTKVIVGA